jgi:hypothetical protein
MKTLIINIFVSVCAAIVGAICNGLLVQLGGQFFPPPAGYDFTTEEGLAAGMAFMEPKHFVFPFLAHAVGTLIGALIIGRFAASHALMVVWLMSSLFFIGGVYMVTILPSPMWFNVLDLTLAYFPMGYLGYRLVIRHS